jgi:hypothetical protein
MTYSFIFKFRVGGSENIRKSEPHNTHIDIHRKLSSTNVNARTIFLHPLEQGRDLNMGQHALLVGSPPSVMN